MTDTTTYSDALSTVITHDSDDLDTVITAVTAAQTAINTVMTARGALPDGPMTNAQLALTSAQQSIDLISTNLASARANYPESSES